MTVSLLSFDSWPRFFWWMAPGTRLRGAGVLALVVTLASLSMGAGEARGQGSVATDRAALVALYNATDGPNWVSNSNWNTDAPLDEWHGVRADSTGRVVELSLLDNNLSGPIPPELGNLANLEFLSLAFNDLSGPIPPELGNLANLETLQLVSNDLSGPIPPELGDLSNLIHLDLVGNNLSGPIPRELGNLANLESLWLGDNDLSGPIPRELGRLANLRQLSLFNNSGGNLSGPIPPELGDLTNLEELSLTNNKLTGPLPSSMTNLRKLNRLWISGNAGLCAPADAAFQDWLATVQDFSGPTCAAEPVPAPALPAVVLAVAALLLGGLGAGIVRRRLTLH